MWRQPGLRRQEPSLRRQAARGRRALPQPCRDLGWGVPTKCSKLPIGASCRHSPRPSNRRLTWVSLHLLSLSDTTEEESRWPLRMSHGWSVAPVLSQSFSTLSDPQGPLGLQRSHSWDQPRADQSRSLQVGPPPPPGDPHETQVSGTPTSCPGEAQRLRDSSCGIWKSLPRPLWASLVS